MITRDLSGLPTRAALATWEPETEGLMGRAVQAWWNEHEDAGLDRPKADETLPYRASWAGLRCDRQLWYALHGVEQSNPPSVADHWRMATGSMGHELLQDKLHVGVDPEQEVLLEVPVDLRKIGIPGSGHADAVVFDAAGKPVEVIELKTVGGFQFKIMTTTFKGGPRGPRLEAVVQGALMAAALDCALRICYVSLELIGADITLSKALPEERRFAAEWVLEADDCAALADAERDRVVTTVAEAYVPFPRLHDSEAEAWAVVSDPRSGSWAAQTDQGTVYGRTWRCGYCGQRERCLSDGV